MIVRKELSGVHFYERTNGLHVLCDETPVTIDEALLVGPRHLSIILTKKCNLKCNFCYSEKSDTEIDTGLFFDICDVARDTKVLDVTLGGGEPTLHSRFKDIIFKLWDNYKFGVSVTSNGKNIKSLLEISGKLSKLRISLDCYDRVLSEKLQNSLMTLKQHHPIGINLLYSPKSKDCIIETLTKLIEMQITDILIIPEHDKNKIVLTKNDFYDLNQIISEYKSKLHLKVSSFGSDYVKTDFLETSKKGEFIFLSIDDLGNVRERSWDPPIYQIENKKDITTIFTKMNPLRR